MKRFSLVTVLLVIGGSLFGQTPPIDSLKTLFHEEPNDSLRIKLLSEIAESFGSKQDVDSAIAYYNKALVIARKAHPEILRKVYEAKANAYSSANNKDLALSTTDSAIAASFNINDTSGALSSMLDKGTFLQRFGDLGEAIFVLQNALKLANTSKLENWKGTALNDLSIVHAILGNEEESINYLLQSIKIREKYNPEFLGVSYGNLANSYKRQENHDEAIAWYKKSLGLLEGEEFQANRIICLRNLGDTYTKTGNYSAARKILKESYDLAKKEPVNQGALAMYHFLMSSVHHEHRDFDSVLVQCQLATDLFGEGAPPILKSTLLYKIANAHLVLGLTQSKPEVLTLAVAKGEEAMRLAKQTKSQKQINIVAELMMKVYGAVADADKTLDYAKLYGSSLDSLNKIERSKKVVAMQAKFEVEKKVLQIDLLEKEAKLAKAEIAATAIENEKQLYAIGIIGLVLVLSLFFASLLYRQVRLKNTANSQLLVKNETISDQNEEKELLLKEIHHRVKNNLQVISSLLDLQTKNIEDASALSAVSDGQNRVKAMALIHHNLYQNEDLGNISLIDYTEQLLNQVAAVYPSADQVKSEVGGDSIQLDIDTAIPVGLILNELLSNAFKYAFSNGNGQLHITLSKVDDTEYQLEVKDNGQGLPADFNFEKAKSLGLRLVRRLTKQLYGKVYYEFNNGAVFRVSFQDTIQRKTTQ